MVERETLAVNEARYIVLKSMANEILFDYGLEHPMRPKLEELIAHIDRCRVDNRLDKNIPQVAMEYVEKYYQK